MAPLLRAPGPLAPFPAVLSRIPRLLFVLAHVSGQRRQQKAEPLATLMAVLQYRLFILHRHVQHQSHFPNRQAHHIPRLNRPEFHLLPCAHPVPPILRLVMKPPEGPQIPVQHRCLKVLPDDPVDGTQRCRQPPCLRQFSPAALHFRWSNGPVPWGFQHASVASLPRIAQLDSGFRSVYTQPPALAHAHPTALRRGPTTCSAGSSALTPWQ